MQFMKIKITALLVCVLAASAALVGCSSGTHEVMEASETCMGCHGEDKATYDVEPENAQAVTSTVTVSTSASVVYICEPLFAYEDNDSFYVPRVVSSVSVTDGSVTIQLEEGTWALVAGQDASASRVLVSVSSDGAQEIEL